MTKAPPNSIPENVVDLSEDEFKEVYTLLKMCLAVEMGIDEKQVPDGEPFVNSCQRILNASDDRDDVKKHYDMSHGFVPLFERLNNARNSPLTTQSGVVYRVTF
jgi:hypothetical protein